MSPAGRGAAPARPAKRLVRDEPAVGAADQHGRHAEMAQVRRPGPRGARRRSPASPPRRPAARAARRRARRSRGWPGGTPRPRGAPDSARTGSRSGRRDRRSSRARPSPGRRAASKAALSMNGVNSIATTPAMASGRIAPATIALRAPSEWPTSDHGPAADERGQVGRVAGVRRRVEPPVARHPGPAVAALVDGHAVVGAGQQLHDRQPDVGVGRHAVQEQQRPGPRRARSRRARPRTPACACPPPRSGRRDRGIPALELALDALVHLPPRPQRGDRRAAGPGDPFAGYCSSGRAAPRSRPSGRCRPARARRSTRWSRRRSRSTCAAPAPWRRVPPAAAPRRRTRTPALPRRCAGRSRSSSAGTRPPRRAGSRPPRRDPRRSRRAAWRTAPTGRGDRLRRAGGGSRRRRSPAGDARRRPPGRRRE